MSNTQRTPEQTEQLKKDLLITMRLTKLRAKYNQQNNQPSSTDNQLSTTKVEAEQKPDWITDRQWAINPNVYHWEQSRKAMELQEQSKNRPPMTREALEEQMRKRRISLGQTNKPNA